MRGGGVFAPAAGFAVFGALLEDEVEGGGDGECGPEEEEQRRFLNLSRNGGALAQDHEDDGEWKENEKDRAESATEWGAGEKLEGLAVAIGASPGFIRVFAFVVAGGGGGEDLAGALEIGGADLDFGIGEGEGMSDGDVTAIDEGGDAFGYSARSGRNRG